MDVSALLITIRAIPAPTAPPEPETVFTVPDLKISDAGYSARSEKTLTLWAGAIAMAIGVYLALDINGFWGLALVVGSAIVTARSLSLKPRFRTEYEQAHRAWREQRSAWFEQAGPDAFERKKQHYLSLAHAHSGLPSKERQKLDELEQKKRQLQFINHMKAHQIDRAKIAGVGTGRKATLASHGVKTAFDVQNKSMTGISGFGSSLVGEMDVWARTVAKSFVFDPSMPSDPKIIQAIKAEIERQRVEIERDLVKAPEELHRLADAANAIRNAPLASMTEAYLRVKQVELDMG
jgi:hypothetical protein